MTMLTDLEKQLRDALQSIDDWLMEGYDDADADDSGYNPVFRTALKLTRAALAAADEKERSDG